MSNFIKIKHYNYREEKGICEAGDVHLRKKFIMTIQEFIPPDNILFNGKLFLVGAGATNPFIIDKKTKDKILRSLK